MREKFLIRVNHVLLNVFQQRRGKKESSYFITIISRETSRKFTQIKLPRSLVISRSISAQTCVIFKFLLAATHHLPRNLETLYLNAC